MHIDPIIRQSHNLWIPDFKETCIMPCLNKYRTQTYLGDIAGLAPDHHSEVNITVKSLIFFGFPVHINFTFTLSVV